jgi:Uma2 family endonuclease
MSAVPKTKLTPAEYLTIEWKAEFKSEFFNGEMFAMAGASKEHCFVKDNLAGELLSQLKGVCRVVTSDMRVKVDATGLYTYTDIVIFWEKGQFEDAQGDTLLNPRVVVEVLSDSTEKYDRGAKAAHYRRIPSLQEYVVVAQDRMLVERNVRQQDNNWLLTEFSNPAGMFEFATVPAWVPLAEVYRDVELPAEPGR